jgi:hypothetical protein
MRCRSADPVLNMIGRRAGAITYTERNDIGFARSHVLLIFNLVLSRLPRLNAAELSMQPHGVIPIQTGYRYHLEDMQ